MTSRPLPLLLLSWVEMRPSGETRPHLLQSQQPWCWKKNHFYNKKKNDIPFYSTQSQMLIVYSSLIFSVKPMNECAIVITSNQTKSNHTFKHYKALTHEHQNQYQSQELLSTCTTWPVEYQETACWERRRRRRKAGAEWWSNPLRPRLIPAAGASPGNRIPSLLLLQREGS